MENNEEWNNFMHKITEISKIVEGLTSDDKETSEISLKQADEYLQGKNNLEMVENLQVTLKYDKSIINKSSEKTTEPSTNPNEMDPETFMKQISLDAQKRTEDKKVRTEKAETFKFQAAKAFKRGEYELALLRYDKAIEQIKDSCLLYTNRALTLLKLKQYEKVCKIVRQIIQNIKVNILWGELWEWMRKLFRNDYVISFVKEIFNFIFLEVFKKITFGKFTPGMYLILQTIYLYIIQKIFTEVLSYISDD